MDTFFHGSSAAEKGTLFHLKNVFGHRSVKKDVGEIFNHAADFMKICNLWLCPPGNNGFVWNGKFRRPS